MVINAGILTRSGITFRKREITTFEPKRTTVAAIPMPKPLIAEVVTANVGQVPNIRRRTGFSLINPLLKIVDAFSFSIASPPYFSDVATCSNRASASLTDAATALDDLVAPVTAST